MDPKIRSSKLGKKAMLYLAGKFKLPIVYPFYSTVASSLYLNREGRK